jgi:hypothetical protein
MLSAYVQSSLCFQHSFKSVSISPVPPLLPRAVARRVFEAMTNYYFDNQERFLKVAQDFCAPL